VYQKIISPSFYLLGEEFTEEIDGRQSEKEVIGDDVVEVAGVHVFEAAEDDGHGDGHGHGDCDRKRKAEALDHDSARVLGRNVADVGGQRLHQQRPPGREDPRVQQHLVRQRSLRVRSHCSQQRTDLDTRDNDIL